MRNRVADWLEALAGRLRKPDPPRRCVVCLRDGFDGPGPGSDVCPDCKPIPSGGLAKGFR